MDVPHKSSPGSEEVAPTRFLSGRVPPLQRFSASRKAFYRKWRLPTLKHLQSDHNEINHGPTNKHTYKICLIYSVNFSQLIWNNSMKVP